MRRERGDKEIKTYHGYFDSVRQVLLIMCRVYKLRQKAIKEKTRKRSDSMPT